MRKVCVVTGYRSDYTKLKSILSGIKEQEDLKLQLIVFGAHMIDSFGKTVDQIEGDGFPVDLKLTTNIDGNTPYCMAKSIGLAVIELAGSLEHLNPDLVLIVGDRYEIFSVAIAASISNIPVAHVQGGELSGTIDEVLRHCITKLSHIHFPSTSLSAKRIEYLGEDPDNIYNVGCPAIDFIKKTKFVGKEDIKTLEGLEYSKLDLSSPYFILIQHPVTTDYTRSGPDMKTVLEALQEIGTQTILIYPNPDAGADEILREIRSFGTIHGKSSVLVNKYKNIPFDSYLNLLKYSSCLIGNSSSGIREAHVFGTPVINVGHRQEGRERTQNIIDVHCEKQLIIDAIMDSRNKKYNIEETLYGNGHAGEKIADILSYVDIDKIINKRLHFEL